MTNTSLQPLRALALNTGIELADLEDWADRGRLRVWRCGSARMSTGEELQGAIRRYGATQQRGPRPRLLESYPDLLPAAAEFLRGAQSACAASPLTTTELVTKLQDTPAEGTADPVERLWELCGRGAGASPGDISTPALGQLLSDLVGCEAGGLRLAHGPLRGGRRTWRVATCA